MRSLSTFSIDDSPVVFEPDLSSMREMSDSESIISADQVFYDSDSNQSMYSINLIDSGASKKERKKSKLQTESKAIIKKAKQEKADKIFKAIEQANKTAGA